MKNVFFIYLFVAGIVFSSYAQSSTAKDSIDQIEAERMELNRLQQQIKAKQDSLVRERVKIEEEQRKAEAARRAALVVTPPTTTYTVQAEPLKIKKRIVKNVVGIAPVHMFITGFEAFYERVLGKKTSIVLSGGYHGMENFPKANNGSSSGSSNSTVTIGTAFLQGDKVAYYGVRLQLQLRAYLFEEADVLEKLYIAPTFLYKHDELLNLHDHSYLSGSNPTYDSYFAEAVSPGLDIGYQIKLLRYFTVSPFVGFMYTIPISAKDDANEVNIDFLNPYRQNLMVRTGLTIGFTF